MMPKEYALEDIFGSELLASLLGVSENKLQKYSEKPETIPENIFKRLAFIIEIVEILRGACNHEGIRQWFLRERVQFGRKFPAEILKGEWSPNDPQVRKILITAQEMNT